MALNLGQGQSQCEPSSDREAFVPFRSIPSSAATISDQAQPKPQGWVSLEPGHARATPDTVCVMAKCVVGALAELCLGWMAVRETGAGCFLQLCWLTKSLLHPKSPSLSCLPLM